MKDDYVDSIKALAESYGMKADYVEVEKPSGDLLAWFNSQCEAANRRVIPDIETNPIVERRFFVPNRTWGKCDRCGGGVRPDAGYLLSPNVLDPSKGDLMGLFCQACFNLELETT